MGNSLLRKVTLRSPFQCHLGPHHKCKFSGSSLDLLYPRRCMGTRFIASVVWLCSPLDRCGGGVCMCVQLCPTLQPHGLYSPPGSCVRGIFRARIMEWAAVSSRGSSQSRDWTRVSCISCVGRQILYHCATWEANGQVRSSKSTVTIQMILILLSLRTTDLNGWTTFSLKKTLRQVTGGPWALQLGFELRPLFHWRFDTWACSFVFFFFPFPSPVYYFLCKHGIIIFKEKGQGFSLTPK